MHTYTHNRFRPRPILPRINKSPARLVGLFVSRLSGLRFRASPHLCPPGPTECMLTRDSRRRWSMVDGRWSCMPVPFTVGRENPVFGVKPRQQQSETGRGRGEISYQNEIRRLFWKHMLSYWEKNTLFLLVHNKVLCCKDRRTVGVQMHKNGKDETRDTMQDYTVAFSAKTWRKANCRGTTVHYFGQTQFRLNVHMYFVGGIPTVIRRGECAQQLGIKRENTTSGTRR